METNPPSFWFCCLHPAERVVMRQTAEALALTLFTFIPLDLWLFFWLPTEHNTEAYRAAFLHLYHLEIVTIVVDEAELQVVRPLASYPDWWVEMALWLLNPEAACLEGCQQSQRPVM